MGAYRDLLAYLVRRFDLTEEDSLAVIYSAHDFIQPEGEALMVSAAWGLLVPVSNPSTAHAISYDRLVDHALAILAICDAPQVPQCCRARRIFLNNKLA